MSVAVEIRHKVGAFDLDVAFEAPPGVTALFGRSGAGKTTVISAMAGLLRPAYGRISINGRQLLDTDRGVDVPVHLRRVGYVFQDARLFPHLSVRQNLMFARRFQRDAGGEDVFARVIDLLGIEPHLARRPGTLSGGERQRVAIGRALLSRPDVLLMDEPLAALDEARKAEILPYLERLRDAFDVPILYVSHALQEVARLATTIVVIDAGRVVRHGPAAQVLADPNAFPLLGRQEAGSIISATVISHDAADGLTELAFSGGRLITQQIDAPAGQHLRVRIRARDIIIALKAPEQTSALNILPGVVREIGRGEGPIVDVQIRCGEADLLARITRRSLGRLGLAPGQACFAILKSIAVARRDVGLFETRGD